MIRHRLAPLLRRPPFLDEILDDRTNNFDLIRIVAAALVLYGHSFFEAPGDLTPGLVRRAFGGAEYAGSVAVYCFFLISGMLITASMEKHRSAWTFVALRFARIWPGFAVCTAVTLFVIVPLVSGVSPHDAAWRSRAASCWLQNLRFFTDDVCGGLSGAFPATPMPDAVGFSWWTLPAEVHCYALVLGLGIVLRYRLSATGRERLRFAAGTLVLLGGYLLLTRHPPGEDARFHAEFVVMGGYSSYPVLFFFAGMLLYAYRRKVPVDGLVATLLAGAAFALPRPNPLVYLALPYGVLAVASAPALRRLKPRHDLSYGLYVYGAAVQQSVATLLPDRSAMTNLAVSLPIGLVLAFASWRLVEAPAIRCGRSLLRWGKARSLGPADRPGEAGTSNAERRSPGFTRSR